MELIGCLDDHEGRTGDQIMGLEQPVDRRFRDEVAPGVGEGDGQFARRQVRLLKCKFDDLIAHLPRNAVPDPCGLGFAIFQRIDAAIEISVIPAMEGGTRNAELVQRAAGWQV